MTLNVDLEDVPFAILEAVKARILANRRRLQQGQQQGPKPSLRPRPQRPRIGASSKSWRMPKEAAVTLDDPKNVFHLRSEDLGSTQIIKYINQYFVTSGSTPNSFDTVMARKYLPGPGGFQYAVNPGVRYLLSGTAEPVNHQITSTNPGNLPYYQHDNWGNGGSNVAYDFSDITRGSSLILPTGYGSCIVVSMLSHQWHSVVGRMSHGTLASPPPPIDGPGVLERTIGNGISNVTASSNCIVSNLAFTCNAVSSRIVSIPAKLQTIVDAINPPATTVAVTIDQSQLDAPWTFSYSRLVQPFHTPVDYARVGFYRKPTRDNNAATPQVFTALNDLSTFAQPSQIKTIDYSQPWISPDYAQGWYKEARDPATTSYLSRELYYGFYVPSSVGIDPETNEPNEYDGEPQLNDTFLAYVDPAGSTFLSNLDLPAVYSGSNADNPPQFTAVWDWDDPEYCRQMCLALGFQPSDLQP